MTAPSRVVRGLKAFAKEMPERGGWYKPREDEAKELAGGPQGQPWIPAQRARIEYPKRQPPQPRRPLDSFGGDLFELNADGMLTSGDDLYRAQVFPEMFPREKRMLIENWPLHHPDLRRCRLACCLLWATDDNDEHHQHRDAFEMFCGERGMRHQQPGWEGRRRTKTTVRTAPGEMKPSDLVPAGRGESQHPVFEYTSDDPYDPRGLRDGGLLDLSKTPPGAKPDDEDWGGLMGDPRRVYDGKRAPEGEKVTMPPGSWHVPKDDQKWSQRRLSCNICGAELPESKRKYCPGACTTKGSNAVRRGKRHPPRLGPSGWYRQEPQPQGPPPYWAADPWLKFWRAGKVPIGSGRPGPVGYHDPTGEAAIRRVAAKLAAKRRAAERAEAA